MANHGSDEIISTYFIHVSTKYEYFLILQMVIITAPLIYPGTIHFTKTVLRASKLGTEV